MGSEMCIRDSVNSDPRQRIENSDVVTGYGAVATAIAKTDPEKAKEVMQAAIDRFVAERRQHYGFGAALNLLVHSSECGSLASEKAIWKLIDEYSNPNVAAFSADEINEAKLRQASEIAVLLGLTGRYPEFQKQAVEKIYLTFGDEGELDDKLAGSLTDLATSFAAIAMQDPGRAVAWHKKFYNRIPKDSRRYIPMPWVVITNALSMDAKELSRYIADETAHQWVIGTED